MMSSSHPPIGRPWLLMPRSSLTACLRWLCDLRREEKQLKKDEEQRSKDPVAYETKKRLEARLSIDSRLAGI